MRNTMFRCAVATAIVTVFGGIGSAYAGWTLAPLAGNNLGAMYPIAIDNGGGVTTPFYFYPSSEAVAGAYVNTSYVERLWRCGNDFAVPQAVDSAGSYTVGYCVPSGGGQLIGFDYTTIGGSTSYFAYPNAKMTIPTGVSGVVVVGIYVDPNGGVHGFLHNMQAQGYISLDGPGAITTQIVGISPINTVFGYYTDLTGDHGFLFQNGFTFLHPPGNTVAYPKAVNASNQVAGYVTASTGEVRPFSWKNGAFTVLQPPQASYAVATSITSDGRLAGYVQTTQHTYYGFVWSPSLGKVSYFNPPAGTTYMEVNCINDWGQVSGTYWNGSNQTTAFIATCLGDGCVP